MKLDIGCGRDKHGDIGIDILRTDQVDVIATAEYLPFVSHSFTEVFSRECLSAAEFEGSLRKAIDEVVRVLKSDGTIIIDDFEPTAVRLLRRRGFKIIKKERYIPKWFENDAEVLRSEDPERMLDGFVRYVLRRAQG